MSLLNFLSRRMVELRQRHGLTQEQLAAMLQTDLKWLQRVEWAKKDVKASTIERIAAVFGIAAPELFQKRLPATTISKPPPKAPHKPRKPAAGKPVAKARSTTAKKNPGVH